MCNRNYDLGEEGYRLEIDELVWPKNPKVRKENGKKDKEEVDQVLTKRKGVE